MKRTLTRLTALVLAMGLTLTAHAETLAETAEKTDVPITSSETGTASENSEAEKQEEAKENEATSEEEREEKIPDFYVDYYNKDEDKNPERMKYYYDMKSGREYKDFLKLSTEQRRSMTDEYVKYLLDTYKMSSFIAYDGEYNNGSVGKERGSAYKSELYGFLSDLYDYIFTSCTFHEESMSGSYYPLSSSNTDLPDKFARVEFKVRDSSDETEVTQGPELRIILHDNFLNLYDCFGQYYDITVREPDKIIKLVNNIINVVDPPKKKEVQILRRNIDLENMTYGGNKMKCLEKLTFTATAPNETGLSFLKEVAKAGDTLKFTVRQIYAGEWLFFMTIAGSKGEIVIWTDNENRVGTYKAFEKFYRNTTTDDNNNLVHDPNCFSNDAIDLRGSADNGKITDVNVTVHYKGFSDVIATKKLDCDNIEYEFYGEDFTVEGGRNLYTILSLTVEKVQKELEEKAREEKNNQYAEQTKGILFKGYTDDKSMYLDYKVLFAAQADLDVSENAAPEWYKDLGKNVKVTILSLMRRIDGKEKRPPYLLIRLKGSEKSRWFKIENESPSENLSNESTEYLGDLHYDMEFRSVKSFDGKYLVGQSKENSDLIYASIRFDYAKPQSVLSGIDFTIDSQQTVVDAENLKYIGGGRTLYENIFYSTDGATYNSNN